MPNLLAMLGVNGMLITVKSGEPFHYDESRLLAGQATFTFQ
jgi:hypothetical protein